MSNDQYSAIVIGTSAGGMVALTKLLAPLPEDFSLPIIIVQHVHPTQDGFMVDNLNSKCSLTVKEANGSEVIHPNHIYLAPPNYHLLLERDKTFSLSIDEKVNYSRPSINVLFESAVDVYSSGLVGILLTGANEDGAMGLKMIKENSGLAIVQDPDTAEYPFMPRAAIDMVKVDHILPLEKITDLLIQMNKKSNSSLQ